MEKEEFISEIINNLTVIIGYTQLISYNVKDKRIIDFCNVIIEYSKEICKEVKNS